MAVSLDELPLPDELPVIPDGWRYESLGDLVEERGVSYGIVQPGSETIDGYKFAGFDEEAYCGAGGVA